MRLISTPPKRTVGSVATGAACAPAPVPNANVPAKPAEDFRNSRLLLMVCAPRALGVAPALRPAFAALRQLRKQIIPSKKALSLYSFSGAKSVMPVTRFGSCKNVEIWTDAGGGRLRLSVGSTAQDAR